MMMIMTMMMMIIKTGNDFIMLNMYQVMTFIYTYTWASLVAQIVKNWPAIHETQVQSLDWEDFFPGEDSGFSSILACRIPWTEEPGELQYMDSQRVGHD